MTYVFDIDGTLCTKVKDGDYSTAEPIIGRIDIVNYLYEQGNTIIMQTARGMGRHMNNPQAAIQDFYAFTKSQLDSWGCKYHALSVGEKPHYDLLICDKTKRIEEL